MTPPDALFSEATADDALVNLRATLTVIRLDLRAGVSRRHHLASGLNLEVGTVEPDPAGAGDAVCRGPGTGETVAVHKYGAGPFGGEATFVPAANSEEEDEGHVVVMVHDESTGASLAQSWVVLDAVTMEAVTMVALPFRVPYGFDGAFLTRDQLATQR
ncbi:9-cis-epoxycarotenoid chloroplastic-like [Hordeum vulgare]|nr:9-cis-epoxycarotenoid chloroplastic-like [Hordeum vulgare]